MPPKRKRKSLTREELHYKPLIEATRENPDAEKAVHHALITGRHVEKVTEGLVLFMIGRVRWDLEKGDAYVDDCLEAREAEAEAEVETEADASFPEQWEAWAEITWYMLNMFGVGLSIFIGGFGHVYLYLYVSIYPPAQ